MSHIAVDLGASGGKMFLGEVNEELKVEEIYRFDNRPVESGDRYVWDVEYLREEILKGIRKAERKTGAFDSIGIDTWGLDFGLIKDGELMRDPYSYRDPKMKSTLDEILEETSKEEIFKATGINHWNVPNTLWQYHYISRKEPEVLEKAEKMIMMPQLISFLLGAEICGEETIASTSQMFDPRTRDWAESFLTELDLRVDILPELKEPGTRIGKLREDFAAGLENRPEILLPVSHDTGAAVAGMPLGEGHRAFLSTGSWFILGIELEQPKLSTEAFQIEASNEMGVEGTARFLKNINGFFILEECRKEWRKNDQIYEYDRLIEKVREIDSLGPLINPDANPFQTVEGDMTQKIASFCRDTGQEVPETEGEITQCIFESLALKTVMAFESLMEVAGTESDLIHLGGGGTRNEFFCEMLASIMGIPVLGGPVEAAACGNILTQAMAYNEIEDIKEGRELVKESMEFQRFEPEEDEGWDEAEETMRDLLSD
ncbi:rhamnulokinase [candidate division MSBL1 archaeon SCGC-AAA259J03]|uniref:Rhamnulokinase n=1 Tax=candidate division MSBL1 archaeon SCGC-AAA259J03 TaxID=1698269 RepID=A0A656YYB9_9EURY|nr:rhamnulokinase [candidate division MSBL1 archaeon SCGC-AAA259J03]